MNFGEKFPYALLTFSQSLSKLIVGHTFSQSLSKLIVGHTFSQKFVEADCGPHLIPKVCRGWLLATPVPRTHTFSQKLSKLVIGYTTPQSLPARPAPYQPHTPHTHTNHTPTIHRLYTHPIPLPCELTATK